MESVMPTTAQSKPYTRCLSAETIAERLETTPRIANELIKTQKIKAFKVGRSWTASEEAFAAYVKSQERAAK